MKNNVFRIDGKKYKGFVWDGCHKIYLIENAKDWTECSAYEMNEILPMSDLPSIWRKTCPLRFINTYGTLKTIIPQCSGVEHIEVLQGKSIITTKL